ncbi:GATA zinc finger domain-containing protein 14-like isoform X2 [Microplitis mediator]|uniref:GATA zinc finger domain-containing protein 14-like isoform X2 n=1 Tax=Microplitis mediator TaxID=375433 RepID=UPI0025559AAC|nr:GATA zinc finger domain-containing protein 14-like isoform X2 [Microplitis mediator]
MDNLYRRNMNKKNVEPLAVDEWLKNEGYFRKAAPKDPGCLFRAVSEQIYMTQFYHTRVRKECVEFMRKNKHLLKHHKGIGTIDNYLEQMSSVSEWGGMTEIEAMSLLYKREFVVFYAGQSTALKKKEVTNNGFDKNIYLCFTPPRHYETVYKNHIIATAAFCQSIVYKILYKNVFKMPDVDAIVEKMLHDDGNGHDNQQSSVSLFNKADGQLTATPPFPYRVAKALDPNIYRNTDFDIWWELKRQVRSAGLLRWNNYRLQVGGKCLVRVNDDVDIAHEYLNNNNYNNKYNNNGHVRKNLMLIGHIQEMAQNEGPVVVFIEELGEKKTVPFKALVPLHSRNNYLPASMMLSAVSPKNKSTDDSTNNKFKKQQFNGYRKAKDSRSPVTSPRFNSNDDENNNNRNSTNYKTSPSKINYSNNFNNKTKSDSSAKNNSNADYSHKKTFSNSQSQSQSILPKPPLPESANPNSNLPPDVRDFERRNSFIEDNKYITASNIQNNFQAHDDKDSSPPCNSVPETFPIPGEFHPYNEINVVNSICIPHSDEMYTNQNQIYCEDKNFGESQSLPPGGFINYSHQVNFRVSPSLDINGNDLPYSDITTLRYFFNLGLEYFHVNQMWWPQGEVPYPAAPPNTPLSPPPSPHAHNFTPESPPGLPVESVQVQTDNMVQQYDNAADAQINYSQPPNPQQRRYINPVCPNDNQTGENNSAAFKNFRKKSPVNSNNNNKYLMKYKNEPADAYNFGKPKYIQGYNENMKENGGNSPRKNQFGKFKKTNQGYQNRTCSKTNYQNDYHQKSYTSCSPDDNYKKKFEKKTTYDYQQQSAAQQQQQKTQLVPTDAPQNQSPQNNCTMSQQMTFANVPYYPNEQENNNVYSPPHTNMYPVSYVPHTSELPEPNNFSGAVMYSSGNFPQQMPPIYSQMMYPPGPPLLPHLTPMFPGMPGQNSQPDWCVPGQPNCVPYPYPASQASESLPLTQSQVKK